MVFNDGPVCHTNNSKTNAQDVQGADGRLKGKLLNKIRDHPPKKLFLHLQLCCLSSHSLKCSLVPSPFATTTAPCQTVRLRQQQRRMQIWLAPGLVFGWWSWKPNPYTQLAWKIKYDGKLNKEQLAAWSFWSYLTKYWNHGIWRTLETVSISGFASHKLPQYVLELRGLCYTSCWRFSLKLQYNAPWTAIMACMETN